MTRERWLQLMNETDDKKAVLTQDEIDSGWHWCDGMDDLLANYNEPDGDCFCSLNKQRNQGPKE